MTIFFSYGHQRWAITFSRHEKSLGVYLVWKNPSEGMKTLVDFSITILNRDHFSQNQTYHSNAVKFTPDSRSKYIILIYLIIFYTSWKLMLPCFFTSETFHSWKKFGNSSFQDACRWNCRTRSGKTILNFLHCFDEAKLILSSTISLTVKGSKPITQT